MNLFKCDISEQMKAEVHLLVVGACQSGRGLEKMKREEHVSPSPLKITPMLHTR